ncbi:MAG: 50S ribosomal protein L7ae [Oscillospiraceae bacterium]|jgi:ribosomal protein L7Ae-like RNA K-turn-binding protein|nr:50S ribosomal protein L7ae [Oscillospiraceae bacterium]
MADPLRLLGLARRAGRLALGARAVEDELRHRRAALLLLARDAGADAVRRAARWAKGAGSPPCLTLPYTKEEWGRAMGRDTCALGALTDKGLAAALIQLFVSSDEKSTRPSSDAL